MIYQELLLSGDGVTAGSYAEVPPVFLSQYDEFTVYVQFSAGTSAGKLQLKTSMKWPITQSGGYPYDGSFEPPLANLVWANVGGSLDWAVASSQKYANVTGIFSALRVYVDTTVVGGTVRVGLVCSAKR